jgi:hypothetical protein
MSDDVEQNFPIDEPPLGGPPVDWEGMARLTRDLRNAAALLTDRQARYFVDAYYLMQGLRVRSGNQLKAMERDLKEREKQQKEKDEDEKAKAEPAELLDWLNKNQDKQETYIRSALQRYADSRVAGVWAQSICGIAGTLAAGLLAHIDLYPWRCKQVKATTRGKKPCNKWNPHPGCGPMELMSVGHIWRFAGLDPTVVWAPKTRRPWNASLKTLCWKIGESFMKVSGNEKDIYGKVYLERKEYERKKNEAGDYKEQAAAGAERVGPNTEAYKSYIVGKLPDGHIHERSKRYATKLFLAHFHHVLYEVKYGKKPPMPYIIEHGGHTDFIAPPNWPMK